MSGTVKQLPKVRQDLVGIASYLAQQSPAAADRFLRAAAQACQALADTPGIGAPWDSDNPRLHDLRVGRIKRFTKYLIFYRPTEDGIEVVRVLHSARDIDSLLKNVD